MLGQPLSSSSRRLRAIRMPVAPSIVLSRLALRRRSQPGKYFNIARKNFPAVSTSVAEESSGLRQGPRMAAEGRRIRVGPTPASC